MIHENSECRATGPARATITGQPLAETELRGIDCFWRACNYLAAGMIYLRDNPLLARPLVVADIKKRLLGHWGSSPGLSFLYIHANRLIRNLDQEMLFLAGPGHGAPGVIAPVWLEGAYGEVHTSCGQGPGGMLNLFRQFSFPGGVGSHCTPELPGSIHEGGELGYVLSHAYGAVLDLPGMIALAVVGDGEAETGPLATSWHSNKFINPLRDGAVLPVLHLNGYTSCRIYSGAMGTNRCWWRDPIPIPCTRRWPPPWIIVLVASGRSGWKPGKQARRSGPAGP